MSRAQALAVDPIAEEAAEDYLASTGSAVGAVLSGFFAACGAYTGVLLGPVSILVAGIGTGARCFDGRLRQPGLGTKRPRGFRANEPIPDSARVAVPTGVAAALVAHAQDGGQRLGSIVRAGIARAESSGARSRASLLRRIREAGAGALTEPSFVRVLQAVAGPSQGGLLTPADFGAVPEIDQPSVERRAGPRRLLEPPWAASVSEVAAEQEGLGYAVCAIDARGVFAALTYHRATQGLVLEDVELEAPLSATPVLRGVTRVAPGARIESAAPIAVELSEKSACAILADPGALRLDAKTPRLELRRDPESLRVVATRRA